jgi:hypothetical protein
MSVTGIHFQREPQLVGNHSVAAKLSEEELNRRQVRSLFIIEKTFGIMAIAFWCGTICFVAYFAFYAPVVETSGQTTVISTTANWLADFRLHFILPAALAGICGLGWRKERKHRIKEREEKDKRIAELETMRDPSRTSSKLDPSGKPKKGGKK